MNGPIRRAVQVEKNGSELGQLGSDSEQFGSDFGRFGSEFAVWLVIPKLETLTRNSSCELPLPTADWFPAT